MLCITSQSRRVLSFLKGVKKGQGKKHIFIEIGTQHLVKFFSSQKQFNLLVFFWVRIIDLVIAAQESDKQTFLFTMFLESTIPEGGYAEFLLPYGAHVENPVCWLLPTFEDDSKASLNIAVKKKMSFFFLILDWGEGQIICRRVTFDRKTDQVNRIRKQ